MADSLNTREPIVPSMDLFGAISDEMRLKILLLLDQAEFTVNEIKDILDIHQSNASRHLAKLSACNLLKDRRDGIKAYYRLSEELYLSTRMLSMIRDAYEELPDKDILKCRAAQVLEDRTDKTKGQIHKLDQAGGSLKAQISLFGRLMYPFENAVDVGCGEGGDLTLMLCNCPRLRPENHQRAPEDFKAEEHPKRDAQGGRHGQHGAARQLCRPRAHEPGASPCQGPAPCPQGGSPYPQARRNACPA